MIIRELLMAKFKKKHFKNHQITNKEVKIKKSYSIKKAGILPALKF
ncbi:hypothetical protein QW060_11430 [Myroides ceti]|uniref:Uncharacterized protein n=1 Tax=Paenimyroides ceti TaxID=395087 RepID=A0ABT8CUQ1_9FLAO|nr:hypothetical protein [Paenimyroides ceti]MDN3707731.1 hypothetical protein [Paenimyroides ceti]